MANLVKFIREVKLESLKVTWPARKETVTTTTVVIIMVAIVAVILLVVDSAIAGALELILGAPTQK